MDQSIFEELKDFIATDFGVSKNTIMKSSGLEDDLGIYGDDVVDLLLLYSEKFKVDISEFNVKKYISPEGDTILPALIRLITGKKKAKEKNLTVLHLQKGIICGKLNDSVIDS